MSIAEKRYRVSEGEASVLMFSLRKVHHYLLTEEKLILLTNHKSIRSTLAEKNVHRRLVKWLDLISRWSVDIMYHSGQTHLVAHYLSTQYTNSDNVRQCFFAAYKAEEALQKEQLMAILNFLQSLETETMG